MGRVWDQLSFKDFCRLFGCGLALAIELATLLRVIRGSKHRFVIKILATLIAGNLAYLSQETVFINMLATG